MVYRGGPRPFLLLKFFFFVFMWSSPPLVGAARNESALVGVGVWNMKWSCEWRDRETVGRVSEYLSFREQACPAKSS